MTVNITKVFILFTLALAVLGDITNDRQKRQSSTSSNPRVSELETQVRQLQKRLDSCRCPRVNCPEGWSFFNSSCWMFGEDPKTWYEARTHCQAQGGDLASVRSVKENEFAFTLRSRTTCSNNGGLQQPSGPTTAGDLSCFQIQRGKTLVGFAEVVVTKGGVEECLRECLQAERIYGTACKSVVWYKARRECILNRETRRSQPGLFVTETDADYYDNECGSPAGLEDCFVMFPQKTLIGYADVALTNVATVDQCKLECSQAAQKHRIVCNSFIYYHSDRECILNTITRESALNLFIDESPSIKVDYYESICNKGNKCFEEYPQSSLVGFAGKVVKGVDVERCKQECLQIWSKCNSIVYYGDTRECILNAETRKTHPSYFTQDVGRDRVSYLERAACSNQQCRQSSSDVILVVDSSDSIGQADYKKVQNFLRLIVGELDVGPDKSQVGLVQFNERAYTEFRLNTHTSSNQLRDAIGRLIWRSGQTNIGNALNHVLNNEMSTAAGNRANRPDIVIVLTDGFSQDNPKPAADQLRLRGATVYAIGVTAAVDDTQLLNIAGSRERVFKVNNFNQLNQDLRDAITRQICTESAPGTWIGLDDNANEGSYTWVDQTALRGFANWARDQPSDKGKRENCILLAEQPAGKWNDVDCSLKRPFVCRRNAYPQY